MNSGDCKGGGTIYTDEIEGIIGDEIRQKLTQLGTLAKCKAKSVDSDLPEQNTQLAQVEREIAALLERLPEADGVLLRYIKQRIEELDGKSGSLQSAFPSISEGRRAARKSATLPPCGGCWTLTTSGRWWSI